MSVCSPLLHAVESFLKNLNIGSVACLFPAGLDPFFLERVFGRAVGLIENADQRKVDG